MPELGELFYDKHAWDYVYVQAMERCCARIGGSQNCANMLLCRAFWDSEHRWDKRQDRIPLNEFRARLTELRKEMVKVNG